MDGSPRSLESEPSARDRLLGAALAAFAAVGFEAASTRAIAADAGVKQGLVRHHFGSKAGLFAEVLEAGAVRLERDLEAVSPLHVEAILGLLGQHGQLARLAAHALLAPGAPGRAVRARLGPMLAHVVELQRAAQGGAPDAELRAQLWIAGAFVASLASSEGHARAAGDALFAWLCAGRAPIAVGPFSAAAARARLRG
jgi:AcrR family transcriptional regulator